MTDDSKNNIVVIKVIFLAALLSGISFYLQHNIDIDMADEGYLLYGAVQTAAGKIPRLDFRAYDPGRYYWMAAWSLLFGEGLTAMRFYLAIFGGTGLCLGLLTARRVIKSFWGLAALGVLLTIWIFPRYHSFEIAFAMATVFFATRLIEAPSFRRYFWTGVFVGIAAFFGKNTGLYGFLAISITALYIWLRVEKNSLLRRYALFIAGVTLGYSPIFIMAIFIPGFFSAFLDSILFIFRIKATNMPLPVPWPWIAFYAGGSWFTFFYIFFTGALFLLMPLFYLFHLARLPFIKKEAIKGNAPLTASIFTGIFYMQYAFSRADVNHLARGIYPLILAMLTFACLIKAGKSRKTLIVLTSLFFVVASIFTIMPKNPFIKKNITKRALYAQYPIRDHKIWLQRGKVIAISTIEKVVSKRIPIDEALFLAPYIPTLYYILKRDSPTWNTYFLFKAPPEAQAKIIASLEEHNVQWAIVGDIPLDGRDDLRFSRTHEMVWAYLRRNFVLVDQLWNIPGYVLIHKREDIITSSD